MYFRLQSYEKRIDFRSNNTIKMFKSWRFSLDEIEKNVFL